MNFEYLSPVDDAVLAHTVLLSEQAIGRRINIHTSQDGLPELKNSNIAIIGVEEGRRAIDNEDCARGINEIRKQFYKLYSGNWSTSIVDLGNIRQGNTVEDTYFAVSDLLSQLLKINVIPIVIGGGQDLTYANYRAYDVLEKTVNLVAVDNKFDFGNIEEELSSQSYLSSIVMNRPNNLFNYSNIGYQTFFNSQEEIDLVGKLFFDAYRLGEVKNNMSLIEPIMRDADIVSIDVGVVKQGEAPGNNNATPNGFYGEDLCVVARYAGISDKVSSFGIYEYNHILDNKSQTSQLLAQVIWYFIEGVNHRSNDYPFGTKDNYEKYIVPIADDVLNFYKSDKSSRWWVEVNLDIDNKNKRHTLVPCTYDDYLSANEQEIPERLFKTMKKVM